MPQSTLDDDITPFATGPVDNLLNSDSLPYGQWLDLRNEQLAGGSGDDGVGAGTDGAPPPASFPPAPGDDDHGLPLSYDPETGRFTVLSGGVGDDSLSGREGQDTLGPLTGRTPRASAIASAVDRIATGPNTSAPIHIDGFDGVLQRGAGQDVHLRGKANINHFPLPNINVDGVLSPSATGQGVTISGIKGPFGVRLPPSVHVYNRPNGELDYEIGRSVGLGPKTFLGPGHYVIDE